jgi:hypothetical protein
VSTVLRPLCVTEPALCHIWTTVASAMVLCALAVRVFALLRDIREPSG